MVGMPESVMGEPKERVRSVIMPSGLRWPDSRLTIKIALADIEIPLTAPADAQARQ